MTCATLAPLHTERHDHAMADEPENLILRMLREMRTEMRERDEKLSAELAAIKAHRVAVFYVPPSPRSRDELRKAVTAALPRIARCLEKEDRPFVRRILPNGALKDEGLA